MYSKIILKIGLILFLGMLLQAGDFKLVEQWRHDQLMPGFLFDAVVDQDGDLVTAFQIALVKIANKNKITDLGPLGQGPNDLDGFYMLCFYKGDLAVEGMNNKLKIFHKQDGKYSWKQTIWKTFGVYHHMVSDGKYMKNRWFLTGADIHPQKGNKFDVYFIRVYREDGKYIKSLLKKEFHKDDMIWFQHMDFHLEAYKNHLYFIAEHEPVLKIISPQSLEIIREVPLKMPKYYKPMPKENYKNDKKYQAMKPIEMAKTWAKWATNYSRIERTAVDGNHLVLQIRTCTEDLKRFALLLYNLETFKLDRIELTDDLLLTVKDGKYYLFENGHPGYDDEAGDYVINIHQFEEAGKNEKN